MQECQIGNIGDRMDKLCEFCNREVVKKLPEKAFTIQCSGKGCDHRTVYGLIDEDCRQVIFEDGGLE